MSVEIDENPKIAMLLPAELFAKVRKIGLSPLAWMAQYGISLDIGGNVNRHAITDYNSYLMFRKLRLAVRGIPYK